MTFWVLLLLFALLITAFLAYSLVRARRHEEHPAAYDLRVYKEQLASVDRDLARGVIEKADAERVRTEISRRILAADTKVRSGISDTGPSNAVRIITIALIGLVLVGGAFALYRNLGAAGYPDQPLSFRLEMADELRENRPGQSEAEQMAPPVEQPQLENSYAKLLEQLRETVANRPDDLQGHILLAQHETNAGNFKAGYEAQNKVIELSGDDASAEEYSNLAEMLILAAGGYVSPEAEDALRKALELDPEFGPARYYWGQMLLQIGRPDIAYRVWTDTLRTSPPGAPWVGAIRAQIDELAYRAGVFNAPDMAAAPAAPGPSQADMEAASEMSPEERQDMIRGMVEQLSDRLATEGGSPQEWARLISALGVLGETERASAIRDEAVVKFADDQTAMDLITSAARQAGLSQ
ncbi:MAG: c-type cytochrome biogenesis protein CcmI [Ruegeria sp.]